MNQSNSNTYAYLTTPLEIVAELSLDSEARQTRTQSEAVVVSYKVQAVCAATS